MIKNIHFQLQQFINLSFLLFLGKYTALLYLSWLEIFYIFFGTLCIEYFFIYLKKREWLFFSYSSLSTAIGVILMMLTSHIYLYFVVILFALFQKHFLQYEGKHFFNPSNFALMTGLLFFYHDTHLVLGQLGHEVWLIWFVSVVGVAILYRVDRWAVSLSFIVSYLLFQYFMIVQTDPVVTMEDIYYRFYSVSFIVFILFMLTDPKTTPSKKYYQVVFAVSISFLTTCLDYYYGFRVQHLFMILFFCSPWVVWVEQYPKSLNKKALAVVSFTVIFLALSAIIYIQMQPPYYFEMDK